MPEEQTTMAADMGITGSLGQASRRAWDLLVEHPGATAAELEAISGLHDGKVRKRLSDLRRAGWAHSGAPRRCLVSGKMAQTWRPDQDILTVMRGGNRAR